MQRWIVTALGKDRSGIVADVTEILYRSGCNLEDSAMTRLEGEFAIMLIFSAPVRLSEEKLRQALRPLERRKLVVHLKRLTKQEASAPRKQGPVHLISVYGTDKPGIVFHMAQALAKARINISDVHTHRSVGAVPSLYLTLFEVELPKSQTSASLEAQLKPIAKRLGVQVSLRQAEPDVL